MKTEGMTPEEAETYQNQLDKTQLVFNAIDVSAVGLCEVTKVALCRDHSMISCSQDLQGSFLEQDE